MDNKKKVVLVVGAAVIAVAVAVSSGVRSLGPQQHRWEAAPLENPDTLFVREMIEKAQGDPNRLTVEERARMDSITRGFTEEVIRHGPLEKGR